MSIYAKLSNETKKEVSKVIYLKFSKDDARHILEELTDGNDKVNVPGNGWFRLHDEANYYYDEKGNEVHTRWSYCVPTARYNFQSGLKSIRDGIRLIKSAF